MRQLPVRNYTQPVGSDPQHRRVERRRGAALASGVGFGSVGSDIARSVGLPANHCGLVALEPTQGRIPHLAPSTMRSAGPMARTVNDLIDLHRIITRPDARDAWAQPYQDTADIHSPISPP